MDGIVTWNGKNRCQNFLQHVKTQTIRMARLEPVPERI